MIQRVLGHERSSTMDLYTRRTDDAGASSMRSAMTTRTVPRTTGWRRLALRDEAMLRIRSELDPGHEESPGLRPLRGF
jgi:hypothetical protein